MLNGYSLFMQNSIHIHYDIFSVCPPYVGILLDAYGVFYGGGKVGLLPGSKEAMETLVKMGKIVGILSNTTQLSANEITKLGKLGLIQGQHFHFLITSGEVSRQIFLNNEIPFPTPRKTFWVLGEPHPTYSSHEVVTKGSTYTEVQNLKDADFIIVSIPHIKGEDQTDHTLFQYLIDQIKDTNKPMVCINPDRHAHEGHPPRPVVRQGMIASMFEEAGGKVYYFGKPSDVVFKVAMKHFEEHKVVQKRSVLMVGDTPETDIKGANHFGIDSALVLTGIMEHRIEQEGKEKALSSLQHKPTFYIKRLGAI